MGLMGEHFDALLTRIENAIKSLLEHDIPEVKAAATDAADAVAILRGNAPEPGVVPSAAGTSEAAPIAPPAATTQG